MNGRIKLVLAGAGIVAAVAMTGATAASAATPTPKAVTPQVVSTSPAYACFFFTGTGLVANRPILRSTQAQAIADCTSQKPLYPHTLPKLKKVSTP